MQLEFGNIFAWSMRKNKNEDMKNNSVENTENEEMVDPQMEQPDVEAVSDSQNSVAAEEEADEGSEIESLKNLLAQREEALEKEKKEYLFLMAEFDNFKKRTLREKTEIIKNGGENAIKGLLPVLDDFERALSAMEDSSDVSSVKEGVSLIYNKFVKYLEKNGVKEIPTADAAFDADLHEAIAMVPMGDADKKGKVVDTVVKGYMINGKVLRHAKVAVGQ